MIIQLALAKKSGEPYLRVHQYDKQTKKSTNTLIGSVNEDLKLVDVDGEPIHVDKNELVEIQILKIKAIVRRRRTFDAKPAVTVASEPVTETDDTKF